MSNSHILELDEFFWYKIVFANMYVCLSVCMDNMVEIYNRNWVQK